MSNDMLNALWRSPDELRRRLVVVDAKRRPSYPVAALVLSYLADRYRPHPRGYVDETVEQIATATGLKPTTIKACLQAFDDAGVTEVVRRSQPGSAPRRTLPLLDNAQPHRERVNPAPPTPEQGGADPAVMRAEQGGADPAVISARTGRGSALEQGGVAPEQGGADPAPPPVLPPEDLSPSVLSSSDATDVVGDRPSGGEGLKKEGEHEQIDRVLDDAAGRVAKLREERGWGKAGPEAIAKLRTKAEEEYRGHAERWLQHADVTETSAAVGVAGQLDGDPTAVPHQIRSPYFEATPRTGTEDGPSATGPAPPSTTTGADPAPTEPTDPSEPQPISALIRRLDVSGETPR